MKILVVEDYPPLLKSLLKGLSEAGYSVDRASDGRDALELATANEYDVIVLDIMLPSLNGFDVLERLRDRHNPSLVLVLTAKDQLPDRVRGLELGADDYLVKPFAFEELLARVRALLRRKYDKQSSKIAIGDLVVDTSARLVRRAESPLDLSAREYCILEYLAHRAGQIVSRTEIWDHVYDFAAEQNSNVIDVYIGHLRRKLEEGERPRLIHTRRGLGYVLESRS